MNKKITKSALYKKWIATYDKYKIWVGPCEKRVSFENTKRNIQPPKSKEKLKQQYRLVSLLSLEELYSN